MTTELRIPYTNCPVCGGPLGRALGTFNCATYPHYTEPLPRTMTWLRCDRCGHVHTDGYWSAEGLAILLAKAHTSQLAAGDFEHKRLLWAPVVQEVFALRRNVAHAFDGQLAWLDVGCGDGSLVMTAAEFGAEAVGLDSRPEAVERIRAFGYTAIECEFVQASASKPVHVISMADVLEHMPFPMPALRKAHSMLHPGGILYLSCPNLECIAWRAMDATGANPYWAEMEHVHNFSRRLLMELLRQCGFDPVQYGVSQRYRASMEITSVRR